MTPQEAQQFIADHAAGLAAIGISITAANTGAGTDLHVEHRASGMMPVLLGNMGDVENFMLGLQLGIVVAGSVQGDVKDRIEGLEQTVAETRHVIDKMADRRGSRSAASSLKGISDGEA